MSWLKGRIARVRSLMRRGGAEARMEEEFAFHIEEATKANIRAGMDPSEARRQALVAFGGVERHRESMRDAWRLVWIDNLLADVRFALRWLRRSPGFAAVAVLTIALGIGATTALFSVTNALLLRSLPVASPEQLHSIQEERSGYVVDGWEGMQVPHARYEAYVEAASGLFAEVAAHSTTRFALRADGPARPATGVLVSGNYFRVLGVRPAHGRLFGAADEPVVVLSHRLWQARFGGDAAVVGRTVYVDGRPLTVAGVAERGFRGTNVGLAAEMWVPYRAVVEAGESAWSDTWLTPFGRLREDIEPRQAETVLPAIARAIDVDAPGAEVHGARLEPMTGMPGELRPAAATFLGLLLGMATLVLLIAAANIAGMQLARGIRRRREVAVRLAMGAGRGRLVRQLLTESMVLFLLGGAAGLGIAWWATRLIGGISLPIGETVLLEVGPDLRVLAFGLAAAAVSGIAFGLLPALRASRPELASALKEGAPMGASRAGRGRGLFVGAQIALAVVLLSVAGLFARTLQTALRADPGFDAERVLVATFDLAQHGYDEESGRAFQSRLLERIRGMAEVESAALARVPLLAGSSVSYYAAPADDPDRSMVVGINDVDAEYFRTLRIELLAGRVFDERSGRGLPAVVVNRTLAQRFWPGENPLGKVLSRSGTEFQVVGVVRDGRYRDFREEPRTFAFFPRQHVYTPRATLHVRTGSPAAEMIERIRHEVALLDPDIALEQPAPLPQLIASMLLPQRIGAYLVGLFGLLGLLLAGVGLYGVLSHHVAERTRELGIRIALGASPRSVMRLVLRGTTLVAALGTAVGVGLAVGVGQLIRGLVFGISPHDPVTFLVVPLLLAAVALLAGLFPARRAVRADPVMALRQE